MLSQKAHTCLRFPVLCASSRSFIEQNVTPQYTLTCKILHKNNSATKTDIYSKASYITDNATGSLDNVKLKNKKVSPFT